MKIFGRAGQRIIFSIFDFKLDQPYEKIRDGNQVGLDFYSHDALLALA